MVCRIDSVQISLETDEDHAALLTLYKLSPLLGSCLID